MRVCFSWYPDAFLRRQILQALSGFLLTGDISSLIPLLDQQLGVCVPKTLLAPSFQAPFPRSTGAPCSLNVTVDGEMGHLGLNMQSRTAGYQALLWAYCVWIHWEGQGWLLVFMSCNDLLNEGVLTHKEWQGINIQNTMFQLYLKMRFTRWEILRTQVV